MRQTDRQTDRQNSRLTGFPSIDKPWLKYYKPEADEKALNVPEDKTVWDVIEESLHQHMDIPAIEYFGRKYSRKEFIDNVYLWARVFKSLGVKEDEIVAYYGPFMPDVCFMTFALNLIGACPYFLKLAISPEALAEETRECRFAIVFDQMWQNVSCEFSKDRFEKVLIARITDAMPCPKKQIVSFLSRLRSKVSLPYGGKYISVPKAKKLAKSLVREVKVPFVSNRNAVISSSSGTTVGGIVKGVVATNESILGQLYSCINSDVPFGPGVRVLNHFPPTAATSLHSLFMEPLLLGSTIILDPRVSEKDFYNQLIKFKPNIVINTGSLWETFYNRVAKELKAGKNIDLSHGMAWMIGGEGTTVKKVQYWNELMKRCGADHIYGGYGMSETFSGICTDNIVLKYEINKTIPGSGRVQAGMVAGVFDKDGTELPYNERGELRVRTKATMKGYYNKPELTSQTIVDGWVRTGDLAEIDEQGFVYIWGRLKDTVRLPDGRYIYLFDIANRIKEKDYIDDAIVLEKPIDTETVNLVAHIVWDKFVKETDKEGHLIDLIKYVREYESGVNMDTFAFYDIMLPYSPTTLKKDKNKMYKQEDGYIRIRDGHIERIRMISEKNGLFSVQNA